MQAADNPRYALSTIFSSAPLPALPQSAVKVLERCQDPEIGPGDLAKPIELDAALVLQVLRFLNSSYFGFQREISSVQQGLALVGVRAIKNFVLWTAVFSATPDPKCAALAMKCFRRDALRRALFAKAVANRLKSPSADEVFTAALLQDIAIPFLARELRDEYSDLLLLRDEGRVRLSRLEQKAFGWTHAEAACLLFDRWNLPSEFATLVRNHVETQTSDDANSVAIELSALLPAENDAEWFEHSLIEERLGAVGIEPGPQAEELLCDVDVAFEGVAVSMNVGSPKQPLAERYLQARGEWDPDASELAEAESSRPE